MMMTTATYQTVSVEYGTRCDGSEDENSWTDEEDGGN